jgi:GTP cyclohydrolase I
LLAKAITTGRRKITKSTNTHSLNLSTDIVKSNSNPDQQRENLRKTPERFRKTSENFKSKQQQRLEFFQAYGKPPQPQRKSTTVT